MCRLDEDILPFVCHTLLCSPTENDFGWKGQGKRQTMQGAHFNCMALRSAEIDVCHVTSKLSDLSAQCKQIRLVKRTSTSTTSGNMVGSEHKLYKRVANLSLTLQKQQQQQQR